MEKDSLLLVNQGVYENCVNGMVLHFVVCKPLCERCSAAAMFKLSATGCEEGMGTVE